MDYYLSYTLNETIAALKPFWEPLLTSGRVLVENNLKGTGYLLGLLDVADLQKVAATRAAFLAFLSRPGVDAELRRKALDGLAQRNSTSHIAELLQAIRRVDEGDATDPQSVLTDLGGMLASRSVDELRSARGEIEALVTSARKKTTRRIGSVALIVAEQGVEAAWERAARSEDSLLDLLETIPLISDPRLRSAVYPKLEEILTSRRMPGTALRSAAIKALPSIPGRQVEALHLLTGFLASAELAPAAVYALDALPREELTDRDRTPLLEGLLGYLKSTPARHRTSGEALAAIRLADELTVSVSSAESANFRARLADLRVTRIVIRPLPHRMQYDRKEIFVTGWTPRRNRVRERRHHAPQPDHHLARGPRGGGYGGGSHGGTSRRFRPPVHPRFSQGSLCLENAAASADRQDPVHGTEGPGRLPLCLHLPGPLAHHVRHHVRGQ